MSVRPVGILWNGMAFSQLSMRGTISSLQPVQAIPMMNPNIITIKRICLFKKGIFVTGQK